MSSYRSRQRLVVVVVLAVLLVPMLSACGGKQEIKKLVIYTAKENEEIEEYLPVAEAALPDLELEVLRLSTGDLTARLLAEKDNPQADVIWGTAATSMIIFNNEGMLEPYAPEGVESILPQFKDTESPPAWVGVDAYLTAFCFNTVVAEEHGLPMPTSWEDLLDPVYEGHIVMPNPASSGTGFMFVSSVLQGLGEEAGWEYLSELDNNMAIYTKSGSKPCKLAGAGEYAIGVSFAFVGARLKKDGAPIEFILPAEGSGYEIEANALLKGANNPEGGKRFLDWAASDEALDMYAKYFAVVAKPGFPAPEGMPADTADRLFPMSFQWSSDNRDAVLEKWTGMFAEKTESD
ncbi:MAG: putative 2-aminoethylphosphonate ABC transporter substrate-binding protein [Chloroflexota bacterium]|nr:putative 2-aminoethylphosphonate ABC transporter substrate-binding protein [Chloroflexota bacterium]